MNEDERLAGCEQIAISMYNAGMGWNLDALMKLTTPEIDMARRFRFNERMPAPPPVQRGVLDRFQDRKQTWRRR